MFLIVATAVEYYKSFGLANGDGNDDFLTPTCDWKECAIIIIQKKSSNVPENDCKLTKKPIPKYYVEVSTCFEQKTLSFIRNILNPFFIMIKCIDVFKWKLKFSEIIYRLLMMISRK